MANKPIIMSKIRQIIRYYAQGKSKREISQLTGAARNTVKRYIGIFMREQLTLDEIEPKNDHELSLIFCLTESKQPDERVKQLLAQMPAIEKELKRKGMTHRSVWKQYISAHPDGLGFTQFYRYVRRWLMKVQPVMHLEHKAGDKMFVDYAGQKLQITDRETGEVLAVEVFAAILACSQLTYVEAVPSQSKEHLIRPCENAMHYFGGVPAAIVPDNLKSAVTKSSKYEPTLNETFEDFAAHYGTAVLPARSYRPRDKALVEGIVKIIYQRIYTVIQRQIFFSVQELNQAIWKELEQHNNLRMTGRDYSRLQQFEELEREALRPLPHYRYEFKKQLVITVMKNGHVCLHADKHYYSVPFQYIGKKVKLLYNSMQVEVYYKLQRIAVHPLSLHKHKYSTLPEHLASQHRYVSDWSPEKFIEQGKEIHPDVAAYIEQVIASKQHPEQAYKSCSGIFHLGRKLGADRLILACRRALDYKAYGYHHILQILERGLDQVKEEDAASRSMPEHQNIRGKEYYQ